MTHKHQCTIIQSSIVLVVHCERCNHTWEKDNTDDDITIAQYEQSVVLVCPRCSDEYHPEESESEAEEYGKN